MNPLIAPFIKGLMFGITIAIIPGPVFFLIIQRTLNNGALIGLLCGLGAITADAVYALVAAIGLTIVTQYLLSFQPIITLFGGLFLLYLGIATYTKQVEALGDVIIKKEGFFQAWFTTFLLTLTNPVTIISYSVIFAGLDGSSNFASSMVLVFGVIVGAFLVVLTLMGLLSHFRQRFTLSALQLINKTAGILLFGFGIGASIRGLVAILGI